MRPSPGPFEGQGLGRGEHGGLGSSRSLHGPLQKKLRVALLDAASATGLSLRTGLLFHVNRGAGRPPRSVRCRDRSAWEGRGGRWPSGAVRALALPGAPLLLPVIILCIVEVVIILLLIFLRKRILIAIALIKEASRSGAPPSPGRGCPPLRWEDSGTAGLRPSRSSRRHEDFNRVLTIFLAGLLVTS